MWNWGKMEEEEEGEMNSIYQCDQCGTKTIDLQPCVVQGCPSLLCDNAEVTKDRERYCDYHKCDECSTLPATEPCDLCNRYVCEMCTDKVNDTCNRCVLARCCNVCVKPLPCVSSNCYTMLEHIIIVLYPRLPRTITRYNILPFLVNK